MRLFFSTLLVALGASAIAQGKEPTEEELHSAVSAHWDTGTARQRQMLSRCQAGDKSPMCIQVMATGVIEVQILSLRKMRCEVSADRKGHLCTFAPVARVSGNTLMATRTMEATLSRPTTWLFHRTAAGVRPVPR